MKKHNASENSFKKKILIICAACGVCIALVIAGETELNDKTWNDFVANVNSMGADDLLDAYKSALERIYGDSAY
jgi:hypothetical protein